MSNEEYELQDDYTSLQGVDWTAVLPDNTRAHTGTDDDYPGDEILDEGVLAELDILERSLASNAYAGMRYKFTRPLKCPKVTIAASGGKPANMPSPFHRLI